MGFLSELHGPIGGLHRPQTRDPCKLLNRVVFDRSLLLKINRSNVIAAPRSLLPLWMGFLSELHVPIGGLHRPQTRDPCKLLNRVVFTLPLLLPINRSNALAAPISLLPLWSGFLSELHVPICGPHRPQTRDPCTPASYTHITLPPI